MNDAVMRFGREAILPRDVAGRRVLEVGSRDVNGSLRGFVESLQPSSYLGVDVALGRGVDDVDDVEIPGLCGRLGGPFDLVICTEVLEHVRDWRAAVGNLKECVRPGGWLLVTTRSPGFPLHEYPGDYWRYTVDDMLTIFADFTFSCVEPDPQEAGVFFFAQKGVDLSRVELYSMREDERERC